MAKVNYVPAGYHTVTPYITVRNCSQAIEFYKKAFGAQEIARMPMPGGLIGHAELKIGDSFIMLSDEMPQAGSKSPQTLGGTTGNLHIYVRDVDSAYKQAVSAGANSMMEPADMFWGDRYCKLTDPYGHQWGLATHIEDVAPEEMNRRAAAMFASPKTQSA